MAFELSSVLISPAISLGREADYGFRGFTAVDDLEWIFFAAIFLHKVRVGRMMQELKSGATLGPESVIIA